MRALITYIEGLTISQGEGAGQPMRLLPWGAAVPERGVPGGRRRGAEHCERQRQRRRWSRRWRRRAWTGRWRSLAGRW